MSKISRNGSTLKQMAYARRIWGAKGKDKQQIALDVGYSRFVAATPKSKIEDTPGFNNAMSKLAVDSNNLALEALSEFKARGLEGFSNKDLTSALNAISNAWSKFNRMENDDQRDPNSPKSKLRTIVLQRVENQIIQGDVKPEDTISNLDF